MILYHLVYQRISTIFSILTFNGTVPGDSTIKFFYIIKTYIIAEIPIWITFLNSENEDQETFLKLYTDRIDELTEAWVPVITSYGKGILVFEIAIEVLYLRIARP
jgi:hypothetical protein